MNRLLPFLALPLLLSACATRKQVLARPLDAGLKAEIDAPFDKIKRAAFDSLGAMSFTVKEDFWDRRDAHCYVIIGSQGLVAGSTGRYARVVIEKLDSRIQVFALVESKTATAESAPVDEAVAKELLSSLEKRSLGK